MVNKGVIDLESQSLFYWNPFCNITNKLMTIEFYRKSQSLFYWNPFCNKKTMERAYLSFKSQSLFYWNPFCNRNMKFFNPVIGDVAILILLESFLQYEESFKSVEAVL